MMRKSLAGSAWLSRAMPVIPKYHEGSKVDAVGQHASLAHKMWKKQVVIAA